MSDRLSEAIKRAINEGIDGGEFERCAVDLLSTCYPNLRRLSGGNDAGQDGLFELPHGRRGFTLHDAHDQGEFVNLLYRNPQWCKDPLDVPAVAGALTRIPLHARPTPSIPFIGREVELEQLRFVQGDMIVVGKPGIGKTFLIQQLMKDDWGLFDALRDISELEDAIRDSQPQRVIIDDAHPAPDDRVRQVLRLRRETEVEFAVVVVTWPGYLREAKEFLPEAERVEVKELDRDEIIQVINAAGLMGPDELLREINDQVVGRAGLAVMLAEACLSGEPFEVATGRRLLASGGTIDEINTWHTEGPRRLILQPRSLRAAAVDDTFFGEPGSVDVQDATEHLPDQSSIGRVLTRAALRVRKSHARQSVATLPRAIASPSLGTAS